MKENFVNGMSTYYDSPEAVLCILIAYQPHAGWGKCRQDTRVGSKKKQCLLKLKETSSGK